MKSAADAIVASFGRIGQFLGVPDAAPPRSERWAAAVGALFGIALVVSVTHALLGRAVAVTVVPSLGAAAVLVFAAPHSLFAQPWSVVGGNLLSALAGVLCQRLLADSPTLAAAAAVAMAVAVMHLGRCIHPPGGATALAAVIGGPDIHQLGFAYALFPIGISSLLLVAAGVAFNAPFAWRRYPVSRMRYVHDAVSARSHSLPSEESLRQALAHLGVVVDVSLGELRAVFERSLALDGKHGDRGQPAFRLGRYYGSRRPGRHWSVRQIVDQQPAASPEHDVLVYRVVEGRGKYRIGSCTRAEFGRWADGELRPRRPPRDGGRPN